MSSNGFLPATDSGLLEWAQGFSPQITSTPTAFGLVAGQATSYASDLSSYAAALTEAKSENTRTRGTIAAKQTAKSVLRRSSMALAAVVRAHPGITDQQLQDLGLGVRSAPLLVPPPALAPQLGVLSVVGRVVRYRLADATSPSTRRKPYNAIGAIVLTYSGATPPPANDPGWVVQGQSGARP